MICSSIAEKRYGLLFTRTLGHSVHHFGDSDSGSDPRKNGIITPLVTIICPGPDEVRCPNIWYLVYLLYMYIYHRRTPRIRGNSISTFPQVPAGNTGSWTPTTTRLPASTHAATFRCLIWGRRRRGSWPGRPIPRQRRYVNKICTQAAGYYGDMWDGRGLEDALILLLDAFKPFDNHT